MHLKFGSEGIAPMIPPLPWRWKVGIAALWCLGVALIVATLYAAARGGCSLPPPLPQNVRRDAVCAALHRGPGCRIKAGATIGAKILSDEQRYSLWIGEEFVGDWEIADGQPIDPTLLTKELVSYHLAFQMGTPELQQRLRTLFRCRRVGFVDTVLEWALGETQILIVCAS